MKEHKDFPGPPNDSELDKSPNKRPADELIIEEIEQAFGMVPDASDTTFWKDFYEAIEKGYVNFYRIEDFYGLIYSNKENMSRKSLVMFHINMGMDFVLADKFGSRGRYKPFRLHKKGAQIVEAATPSSKPDPETQRILEIGKAFGFTTEYLDTLKNFGVKVKADKFEEGRYPEVVSINLENFYTRNPYDLDVKYKFQQPVIILKNKNIDRVREVRKTQDGTLIISYDQKNILGRNTHITNLELSKTPYSKD